MNLIGKTVERTINAVSPAWGLRRHAQREQVRMGGLAAASKVRDDALRGQFYAAANPGINRPFAPMLSTPEDYKEAYERIVMIRYGRQLETDVPYVESILGDFETYVVGDLRYRASVGNKDADKLISEHLEWRFSQCDYAEKLDLTSMAKLAIRSKKRDGECGFVYVDVGDALRLSAIEADRIGNPLIGSNMGPENYNGIIVDPASGAPVAYDIWRRLPKLNAYVFEKRVEANQFIHFYDQFRFAQWHGVTAFKSGITRAIDLEQTIQFAIQNIKFRSSQLPAIQNELGRPKVPGSGYEAKAPNLSGVPQPYQLQVDGVTQSFIKLGEGFVEFPHDFPNANFGTITAELKGDVALGVHLPGEFCFRSEAGGVVQRFYVQKAERTFDEEKRLLRRNFLTPYKNRVLRKDVDSGMLNLDAFPGLAGSLALYQGQWHMGRSVSTDYGREVDSDIKLIDANLMSPEEFAADNARDLDEIRRVKKRRALEIFEDTAEVAQATGRPFSEVLSFIQKQFPNPTLRETATDKDTTDVTSSGDVPTSSTPAAAPQNIQAAALPTPVAPAEPAGPVKLDRETMIELAAELLRLLPRQAPQAQPNFTINNTPPAVTVNNPAVTVNQPAMTFNAGPVNVEPAEVVVNAPVTVNTPEQPAAQMSFNMPASEPPVVNVNLPPNNALLRLDRDKDGKIVGGKIT